MHLHIFVAGLIAAVPLMVLLAATIAHQRLRFWPTPGPGTCQSLAFWFLFRTLNMATLLLAALDRETGFWLPWDVRALGLAMFLGSGAFYLYTLFALGRANTYCRRGGLVTDGIYRWTRNPQYATVIPAYTGLAVAAPSAGVVTLAVLLIGVYVLMAHAEEPWLRLQYGEAYERYSRAVPRFYNFTRAWRMLRGVMPGPPRANPVASRRGGRRTHKP
jgi:protein-S-isoprenylcysteine O-methyltransferase Ste14